LARSRIYKISADELRSISYTEPAHHARKRFLKPFKISFNQLPFDVEHKVETLRIGIANFILPYDLSESSFAAVANHGAAYFARHGNSISPLARVVSQKESRKERSMNLLTLLINSAKLLAIAQRLHQ
jgi:hypothetical protein